MVKNDILANNMSPMQWTWTWANFRRWWGTERPGMLQSMWSQRVGHDWATEQLYSSHTLAKQCSKFSKLSFNGMWNKNFQMFKLYLEKAEEPEIKLPSFGSSKKQDSSKKKKHLLLLYWLCQSLCGPQQTLENSSRDGNIRPLPASWEVCIQVKRQQLETDMEQ